MNPVKDSLGGESLDFVVRIHDPFGWLGITGEVHVHAFAFHPTKEPARTTDRDEVFLSLRSIHTTSVDDFSIFEEVFRKFWSRSRSPNSSTAVRIQAHASHQTSKGLAFFLEHWGSSFSSGAEPVKVPGASDTESARAKDFSEFTNDELEEVSRLARRMVRRLARKPSRRWRPVRRGRRVNLRRSLRLSLKTGGELIELTSRSGGQSERSSS